MAGGPISANGDWSRLVVEPETAAALVELEARCRFSARLDRFSQTGVQALFTGPAGTGKTLAVGILAARLGRTLTRVDLGSAVGKYVGETEKNLQFVFKNAARDCVVLLFEEADTLFGKRTEVGDAHDRYANMEAGYLLQAVENWRGIAVLTANSAHNIAPVFRRRLHAVIEFPPPNAAAREHLWQLHLPAGHVLDGAWLQDIAARCPFTGGQIRNAVLAALLITAEAGDRGVTRAALEAAIRREYRRRGQPCPLD